MLGTSRGPVLREIDRLFQNGTLSGLGDDELLQRFLGRRDGSAFEALVTVHGPMVLGICRRMLHDPRDVEDAFQATFLVLVRKAPVIRDRNLLSSWLYGVAYRVANRARLQTIQRRSREIGVDRLDAFAGGLPADFADIGSVLDQELNRLPRKYRDPLVLCYLEGCTHDQAAEQLRCPVGTVRSRMARGRDLLKRRLTRRGCMPVGGMLCGGASLPFGLGIESVPSALLSSTVRSALQTASFRAAGAATASAPILTLTQGVLTTMKLSQMTWIAVAMLATSVSATGVIAVALARAQSADRVTGQQPSSVTSSDSIGTTTAQISGAPSQSAPEAFDARLKALESKIDALLSRFPTTTSSSQPAGPTSSRTTSTTATSYDPLRPYEATITGTRPAGSTTTGRFTERGRVTGASRHELDLAANTPATVGMVRELETQLKLALEAFDRTEVLFQRGNASRGEREQTRGKVLLALAVLEGLDDDLADELEQLRLDMKKKTAELHQTEAQKEVAESVVGRNRRLNERKPGTLSDYDVAKAAAELRIAEAQIDVKRAELEGVSLQASRLARRRERIAQAIRLSARAQAEAGPTAPRAK
jgi:RNA polymerase sigma factor (sigma-70 family)